MDRRAFLSLAAALAASPAWAEDFAGFVEGFRGTARAAGVSDEIFESVIGGLSQDPSLSGKRAGQGEFTRPLKTYVDEAASPARAKAGRDAAQKNATALNAASRAAGVPGEMIVALWGMESDFGRSRGDRDIFRTLATLAFLHPDNPVYAQEFVAGLVLLQKGLPREKLRGSWAGAMGDPQFMPSAYLKYAKSASGGAPDIWNAPDSLLSIGNFLHESSWAAGLAPLIETRAPEGFDYATLKQDFAAWRAAGFKPLDGGAQADLPRAGAAMLFFPVGAEGPAFLLSENFFVLKAYNFSDSYAFAGSVLAERIAGRPALRQAWPAEAQPLSAEERADIQRGLMQKGLYDGKIDGRFGPVTRLAIHALQRGAGVARADGYPSRAVLDLLRAN
ncbi:lytic murein transglycosylase [Rhodoblastus acidophilus]|uniref:Lytic murein transglycosylase n=1 Tax=Rhodoblastus acidophilus TaxID=1074 RepID=A0A212QK61_RHOAC|nr:lytic murein transglycosylase [Rhodoblastus acidophilus]PPQ39927.1 lytic murein transglycosylase [Rhodoblastus acidophilus]RAI23299.1 lytic murein transglycosylase [Rhodoblastus acidophilus]SNB59753.1 lytic murein transglycosylase [Rhodoblastus acidophilus]